MFRFTIRDVLWLTLVVAFIVCWRVEVHRQSAENAKVQNHLRVLMDGQAADEARLRAVPAMDRKIRDLELNSLKRKVATAQAHNQPPLGFAESATDQTALTASLAPRGAAVDNRTGSSRIPRRLTLGPMFDYEGSRGEFLKLLAEFGEEPAFLARARAPQQALDALLQACELTRMELMKWPNLHLSTLAQQIGKDWSRLGPFLVDPESVAMLEAMHAAITPIESAHREWLVTDRSALHRFLKSAERFNHSWRTYVDGLDLELANAPRRDFNRFYVLEKTCAYGSDGVTEGFEPLAMIDREYVYQRFPFLVLPRST